MAFHDVDRFRIGWWLFGLALGVALTYVVYAFVGTFVFGLFLYYATRPIYRHIRRRVYPPSLAAAIALFALALPALLLVIYSLSVAVRELQKLLDGQGIDVVQYLSIDQQLLNRVVDPATLLQLDLERYLTSGGFSSMIQSLTSAADTLAFVGVGLVHLFAMIALAFYLLRDDRKLSRWVLSRFGDERGILRAYVRTVDRDFNGIFFGNILNAVLTATIGVIAFSLLNTAAPAGAKIPAAALVGLLAGVASLIPVVGMKLVYFPVAIYVGIRAFLVDPQTLWFVAVFALVAFVVVDTIPDLVLRPYVSGRSLHVGALMIAYTFGPLLFGWYGIFLMPMLLVLTMHFARLVLPELLTSKQLQPYAVDPGYLTDPTDERAEDDGELPTD
ncbi:AI-2E family transporter [Haloplanus sp. GCM10025708]|uniref:AI-2E family transporter n=1 Tax=Haloferacaceae TaxID=1644056 RepID=UPI00360EDB35